MPEAEVVEPSEPPNWEGPYDWHPDCVECKAALERGETTLNHSIGHCPYPESHNWGCGCPTDQSKENQ